MPSERTDFRSKFTFPSGAMKCTNKSSKGIYYKLGITRIQLVPVNSTLEDITASHEEWGLPDYVTE